MSLHAKQVFLETFDREHATTMKVLRAYPDDQLDLKPAPQSNSAKQIAWVFALENYLGIKVWHDEFAKGTPSGKPPAPPEKWSDLLDAIEKGYRDFRELIEGASVETLEEKVHFMTGPKTMGEWSRMNWIWFLLHDQIHHRGQFSVYLRMSGAKVPSIYGPTADEPWI